jgi:formamidopyrimidine-DNA glycosylase
MSLEAPEIRILAEQMTAVLPGKTVAATRLDDYQRMQQIGFFNADVTDYARFAGSDVAGIRHRGMTLLIDFANGWHLMLSPEYGGRVRYHPAVDTAGQKTHLLMTFTDGSRLAARMTGMGVVTAHDDIGLVSAYLWERDFGDVPGPFDTGFTADYLAGAVAGVTTGNMKSLLVGRDAVVVGFGNASFQDIIHRAELHPKRKGASLDETEVNTLHASITELMAERLRLGGKVGFEDLNGTPGKYEPRMGPRYKGDQCPDCGTPVESMQLGGGVTYFCPECQQ